MKRHTISIGMLGLLVLATPVGAQDRTDPMLQAFAKAYISNPTLLAERAKLRATDENVTQAISLGRPKVTASASGGVRARSVDAVRQSDTTHGQFNTELQVTQPLYRGGRISAEIAQAENQILAARAGLSAVEQDVFLQVGTAYMDVVARQAVVELNRNNEVVLQRQLQATRDRFQVGEVTLTDVRQAEARVARATADRRQAEGNLEASRADYEQVVGEPPGILAEPANLVGLPTSRQGAIDRGIADNPSVIRAKYTHLAAVRGVRAVSGELLPDADLVGRGRYEHESDGNSSQTITGEALVRITIPLYSSGSVRSRTRQAKRVASQRLVEIEEARRLAVNQATVAWEQYVAIRARIEALRSEVRAQEVALEGVQQEVLVGTRTVLEVLDAEQELLSARVNLVEEQRNEVVAQLKLASAVGILTAGPMNLDVPLYDVRRNYQDVRGRWLGTDIESPWQPAGR